ncbi:MAG: glycogen/starch/alpha-glucan phosphorylase [Schwartzia sp.]|nr:glycogen/starch/alpha-glucan phosphorylase [Schwartzia sp. (in: firmicutes)]
MMLQNRFVMTAHMMWGRDIDELSDQEIYRTIAATVKEMLSENWIKTNSTYDRTQTKQIYYFSVEFLLGRLLNSNLINLGVKDLMTEALGGLGISLGQYYDEEADAGLGNGGLGRLAACFIDSMAALALPGHGCSIRYHYGLFKQQIVGGQQVELPDTWLRDGFAWEYRKPDKAVNVRFGGNAYMKEMEDGSLELVHEGYTEVLAVPYDVPIVGAGNHTVNTLRLWNAEVGRDFTTYGTLTQGELLERQQYRQFVNNIVSFLYPDDSSFEGRRLRLIQEYFFVAAGVKSILRHLMKTGLSPYQIADKVGIHINDTHPALAVPELMRILVDEGKVEWEEAWDITKRTIAYTNHTIMPEALEKWSVDMLKPLLPRIYMIIEEINRRFLIDVRKRYPNDEQKVRELSIIENGQIHMARLAIVGSHSVNGVAAIHTDILKHTTLKEFNDYYPGKINNKTNGITHRRWLIGANSELAEMLDSVITPVWRKEPSRMADLAKHLDDKELLERVARIKMTRKKILARWVREKMNIHVNPDTIFDIQVKRIHSYKRQLMNIFHVIYLYDRLKKGELKDAYMPTTFFFGGKAAPGYYIAKETIRLICAVSDVISRDKDMKDLLQVVFIENFGVSLGEMVYPAADVSEQISTASKEASGTGNMKFMMNGAITLGTLDGANVEIRDEVGDDNCVIFGLTAQEVIDHYAKGDYSAWNEYHNNESVRRVLDRLIDGTYGDFDSLYRYLLDNNDEFFIMKDFDAYKKAHEEICRRYKNKDAWRRSMLMNIARSGKFSSDRTIREYARDIWHIHPVEIP